MSKGLFVQAITKVTIGIVLTGALLFLPAGSFSYWQGWLLLSILFIPMLIAGFVMMKKSPELLKKRLNAKEKQSEQKLVVVLSGLLFLSMPLVLGSLISFFIMLVYIPIIALRIRNEEKVLEEGLEGYSDYKKRVRYRVIPFIW